MQQVLLVGTGGFLGAVARYLVSKYTTGALGDFPLGTLIVNLVGSLMLGFVMYSILLDNRLISPEMRSFIAIGFIGALTTMSTFSYETYRLADLGNFATAGINMAANIIGCLFAIYLGKQLAVLITGIIK